MTYNNIVFKKNPHNLKVGKLYQLYWGVKTKSLAELSCTFECAGADGIKRRWDKHTNEPFLVIELDVYVCRILLGDGTAAFFSYRRYWREPAGVDYSYSQNEYSFKELKEEE